MRNRFKGAPKRIMAVAIALILSIPLISLSGIKASAKQEFNQRSAVTALPLNTEGKGNIAVGGQKWYSFTTNGSADYSYTIKFKSVGLSLAHCYIYDSDGARIKDIYVSSDYSSEYADKLSAGSVYYIQIFSDSGNGKGGGYTLSVDSAFDESNSQDGATYFDGEYSGNLFSKNDVDYLSFNSGINTSATVTVKNINGKFMHAQVFKADGTKVDKEFIVNNASEYSQTVLLKPNTLYYIKVYAFDAGGDYKISLTGRIDEANSKKAAKSAKTVKPGKNRSGIIDTDKDEDFFKIKLDKTKNWKFIFKNTGSQGYRTFSVYKSNKNLKSITVSHEDTKSLNLKLKKGTYYVKVSGKAGSYAFKVKK